MTETSPDRSVQEERLYAARHWRDVAGDDALAKIVTSVINQTAFRGRNDDGTEVTATWKANENTNWTQAVDVNFRVRFEGEETAGGASKNIQSSYPKYQYNLNAAGWNAIAADGSGTVVKAVTSTQFTGPVTCTDQMTTSAKAFVSDSNCALIEQGGVAGATLVPANQSFQSEITLQIVGTGVSNGDTLQLRWIDFLDAAFDSYTNTPSITVSKAAPATPDGLWDDSVVCAFAIVDF